MHPHPDPDATLERLLGAILNDRPQTARAAWQAVRADSAAVAAVRKRLAHPAWQEPPSEPGLRHLASLLTLLHALDPAGFDAEIDRLRAAPLHPRHRLVVEVVARRQSDPPAGHLEADRPGEAVPVHVAPELGDPGPILTRLATWRATPGVDLTGVVRIDISDHTSRTDDAAGHASLFSGLHLHWHRDPGRGLHRWLHRHETEFAFYLAVAKHAAPEGDDGEAARAQAQAMLRRAHPVLTRGVRLLAPVLKPVAGRLFGGMRG